MKTYNFYTFDRFDNEIFVVIPVKAESEDEAWDIFEENYPAYFVDQVLTDEQMNNL